MWLLENFKLQMWLTFVAHITFLLDTAFLNHCFPVSLSHHLICLELPLVLGMLTRKHSKHQISPRPRSVCPQGKVTYIHICKRSCKYECMSPQWTSCQPSLVPVWLPSVLAEFPFHGKRNYKEELIFSISTY